MLMALPLFLLRHVSGADNPSMLQGVLWLSGGSKNRRCSVDSVVSIVRAKASHLFRLFTLKGALRAPIKSDDCFLLGTFETC